MTFCQIRSFITRKLQQKLITQQGIIRCQIDDVELDDDQELDALAVSE